MTPASRRRTRTFLLLAGLLAALAAAAAARLAAPAAAAPTDLFISEYVEGSSNNKALELYNGTGAPVTLTGVYDVQIFANGGTAASATIPLTGTVSDGDVFVLARSSAVAAVLAEADQTSTNFLWNGNDALALRKDGAILDVIGQIGVDPGTEWGTGDASTTDNTLRRKPSVQAGDLNGADAFDPALEWDGFAIDTFDGLGGHSVSGGGGGGGGGNGMPVAAPDSAVIAQGEGPVALDVLGNDTDPDGDSLAIVSATDPGHGSVSIAADGSRLSYEPDAGYAGVDSFGYTISDGRSGSAAGSVSITVEAAGGGGSGGIENDAVTTPEDTPVTVDVLANDQDAEGDPLAVVGASGASHGEVTVSAGGVRYEPDSDFNGSDTFEYAASDGSGEASADVHVTVTPVDDPPRPGDDSASAVAGAAIVIDVLANDVAGPADEDGQTLTVVSVSAPAHGTAEVVASGPEAGQVRYSATDGFEGADTFSYTVSDGAATATADVTVEVGPESVPPSCSIWGTSGDDVITGTPGDDRILAGRGDDVVAGNGGDDVVWGGPGDDRIRTGAGDDRVSGGRGDDVIATGGGSDRVRGGRGRDDVSTGDGGDSVSTGRGDDRADAGGGDNAVCGGVGKDRLRAGSGDDLLDGGAGSDDCDADGGRNRVVHCEQRRRPSR